MAEQAPSIAGNQEIFFPPRLHRTKTIATVGPATSDPEMLRELILAGVDVFRLNMAHGTRESHGAAVSAIREISAQLGIPAGILIDLAGPKIRLGAVPGGSASFATGDQLVLVGREVNPGAKELECTYHDLARDVTPGDSIVIGDGIVRLRVDSRDGDRVVCRVVDGGTIRSRQGVNLPGVKLAVRALSASDLDNARWAAEIRAEFVSLSFVRSADEVADLKQRLHGWGSEALVISKIEKRESLEQLEAIVDVSDAVMVARGDLGVEIEIEKTPLAQKRIIRTCGRLGKPVIVATQMLESMNESRFPTRAEVSDVANAILDGADACMLSGETATGKFPLETVRVMRRIQRETENVLRRRPSREANAPTSLELVPPPESRSDVLDAVLMGAAMIARRADAKLVVLASSSLAAAILKSKQRDFVPVIAVTENPHFANQLSLLWGISPVVLPRLSLDKLRDKVREWLIGDASLQPGDRVVLVGDSPWLEGQHDTVVIWEIG